MQRAEETSSEQEKLDSLVEERFSKAIGVSSSEHSTICTQADQDIFDVFPAFFADVSMLKYFTRHFPELLILPWELQKRMSVLVFANPSATCYTFVSHQWDAAGHPFPDAGQVLEIITKVTTPYIWLDWYCTPQWSHPPRKQCAAHLKRHTPARVGRDQ